MMKRLLTLFFYSTVCLTLSSCAVKSSTNPVLRHINIVSHDYYYVNVSKIDEPFVMTDIVGGEHENHYQILGFQGDQFLINVESSSEDLSYGIDGRGFEFTSTPEGDLITVMYETTWVDIFTWSYPDTSEYTLKVRQLNTPNND